MKAEVIYTYTGNDFNSFYTLDNNSGNVLTSSDFLTFQLTLADPLGANLYFESNGIVVPSSWSASDGVHTWSSIDAQDGVSISLSTDSLGDITAWSISGYHQYAVCEYGDWCFATANNSVAVVDRSELDYAIGPLYLDQIANDPGTWTESASSAPEPGTWLLWVRRHRCCSLALAPQGAFASIRTELIFQLPCSFFMTSSTGAPL